jgi:hypothetical protein
LECSINEKTWLSAFSHCVFFAASFISAGVSTSNKRNDSSLAIRDELTYNVEESPGAGFAYPSQSIHFEAGLTDQGEVFVPPTAVTSN